jgi:hypothetical protein
MKKLCLFVALCLLTLSLGGFGGGVGTFSGVNSFPPTRGLAEPGNTYRVSCTAIDGNPCSMAISAGWLGTQAGDVLIYACGCTSTSAAADCSATAPSTGVTELNEITNGGTTGRMAFGWILIDSTNIAENVTCPGSGGAADATVGVMRLLRFPHPNLTIPDTPTTATGSSTDPNPAAITTTFDSTAIHIFCASAVNDGAVTSPAPYNTATATTANDTGTDMSIAVAGNTIIQAALHDPGAYGGWSSGQWICATVPTRRY